MARERREVPIGALVTLGLAAGAALIAWGVISTKVADNSAESARQQRRIMQLELSAERRDARNEQRFEFIKGELKRISEEVQK